jgi:Fe-S-cluster-containing hydrogenase component 2
MVQDLCSPFSGLSSAVEAMGATRVVVGCSHGHTRHQRILGKLREAGIHPSGAAVVNLATAPRALPVDVVEQALARLRAALAQVSGANLDGPMRDRVTVAGQAQLSRRDLFGTRYLARRPVAYWAAQLCRGRGLTRPCTEVCVYAALSVAGSRVCVDADLCTGCGACLSACRSGAMELNGTSLSGLEAAARILAQAGARQGLGLAIVCSNAAGRLLVGGCWLPLEVPSLEMVTAGWVMQLVAAGVGVTLIGCSERACAERGRELAHFTASVLELVAPCLSCLVVASEHVSRTEVEALARLAPKGERRRAAIVFVEPEATTRALSSLASVGSNVAPPPSPGSSNAFAGVRQTAERGWRVGSPVAPLGEIVLDAACCSGCACCASVCPTGALAKSSNSEPTPELTFDASLCPACGACVAACPEGALSLARALGWSALAAGRRPVAQLARQVNCRSCGRALAGQFMSSVVADKLALSHPQIAKRLRAEGLCAECLTAPT